MITITDKPWVINMPWNLPKCEYYLKSKLFFSLILSIFFATTIFKRWWNTTESLSITYVTLIPLLFKPLKATVSSLIYDTIITHTRSREKNRMCVHYADYVVVFLCAIWERAYLYWQWDSCYCSLSRLDAFRPILIDIWCI